MTDYICAEGPCLHKPFSTNHRTKIEGHIASKHLNYFPYICGICDDQGIEIAAPTLNSFLTHTKKFHPDQAQKTKECLDDDKEEELEEWIERTKQHSSASAESYKIQVSVTSSSIANSSHKSEQHCETPSDTAVSNEIPFQPSPKDHLLVTEGQIPTPYAQQTDNPIFPQQNFGATETVDIQPENEQYYVENVGTPEETALVSAPLQFEEQNVLELSDDSIFGTLLKQEQISNPDPDEIISDSPGFNISQAVNTSRSLFSEITSSPKPQKTELVDSSKSFKRKSKLSVSQNKRRVTCQLCQQSVQASYKQNHITVHHFDVPYYYCLYCKYEVRTSISLYLHLKTKHGNRSQSLGTKKVMNSQIEKFMDECFGDHQPDAEPEPVEQPELVEHEKVGDDRPDAQPEPVEHEKVGDVQPDAQPEPVKHLKVGDDRPNAQPEPVEHEKVGDDRPNSQPEPVEHEKVGDDRPDAQPEPVEHEKVGDVHPDAQPEPVEHEKVGDDWPNAQPEPVEHLKVGDGRPDAQPEPVEHEKVGDDRPDAQPEPVQHEKVGDNQPDAQPESVEHENVGDDQPDAQPESVEHEKVGDDRPDAQPEPVEYEKVGDDRPDAQAEPVEHEKVCDDQPDAQPVEHEKVGEELVDAQPELVEHDKVCGEWPDAQPEPVEHDKVGDDWPDAQPEETVELEQLNVQLSGNQNMISESDQMLAVCNLPVMESPLSGVLVGTPTLSESSRKRLLDVDESSEEPTICKSPRKPTGDTGSPISPSHNEPSEESAVHKPLRKVFNMSVRPTTESCQVTAEYQTLAETGTITKLKKYSKECHECNQVVCLYQAKSIKRHVIGHHLSEPYFLCRWCKFTSKWEGSLDEHNKRKHHRCKKNFKINSNMDNEIAEMITKCFDGQPWIEREVTKFVSTPAPLIVPAIETKIVYDSKECLDCKLSVHLTKLKDHIGCHLSQPYFLCHLCEYSAKYESTLVSHYMKKHRGCARKSKVNSKKMQQEIIEVMKRCFDGQPLIGREVTCSSTPILRQSAFLKKAQFYPSKTFDEDKRIKCLKCGMKVIPLYLNFKRHILAYHVDGDCFACGHCSFTACWRVNVTRHCKEKHRTLGLVVKSREKDLSLTIQWAECFKIGKNRTQLEIDEESTNTNAATVMNYSMNSSNGSIKSPQPISLSNQVMFFCKKCNQSTSKPKEHAWGHLELIPDHLPCRCTFVECPYEALSPTAIAEHTYIQHHVGTHTQAFHFHIHTDKNMLDMINGIISECFDNLV